jgi:tetratricopeptide (TPR) repeat protein
MDATALPPGAGAMRDAAVAAHRKGDLDAALRDYAAYLALVPSDAGIWSNLGVLCRVQQRHDAALRAHQRAYALNPDGAGVRNNYANTLSDIGDYAKSIKLRRRILRDNPDDRNHLAMIGRCLRGLGRYDDAIAHLEPAIARFPDEAELRVQLAFAQLGAGDYAAGFRNYRARWQTNELTPRSLPIPQWDGESDLTGKTVIVMPEQGFGDAVLFARFLPQIAALGPKVLFLAEKPMLRLFEGIDGADWVGAVLPPDLRPDCYVNLMDLALLNLKGRADIPPPVRLKVPPDSIARARGMVAPHADRFKVGVVWTGSVTYRANVFRSFSHTDLLALTDLPGVQLFSLYKGPALDDFRADASNAFIVDAGSSDRDFADCAAMMQQMDLIITSDTATAHIAGSLGVPVWTVLHWDPFWVFSHKGTKTPWYPGMQLYRQDMPRNWSAPFARIRKDLKERVHAR